MKRPVPAWDPELDDVFVCVAIRPAAPGIATVVLAPRQAGTTAFEAGQHVTVEFPVDGASVHRCYTIASPPTRPERLAITVKRRADGIVSRWLHDGGLAVGSTVRVGAPAGEFTLQRHPAAAYLFLTAGTGITPALSVLRETHDLGGDLDLVLVHSERRGEDVPHRAELEAIVADLAGVRLHHVCSSAGDRRLDAELLARLVPDAGRREVFVCGPDGYRAAARSAVAGSGALDAHVHEESFVLEAAPRPRTRSEHGGYRVEFRQHGRTIECPPDSTLLDAAIQAGVPLSFSCAQGLCGTCKSTLVAGDVDMRHNGGIRPREIAAGRVLLCCSTPRSDLVISA